MQLESFESISVVQLEVFGRSPEGCGGGGYGGWGDRYTSCSNHCWYIILGLGEFSVKLFLLTPLSRYLSTFKCLMYYDCPYTQDSTRPVQSENI